MCGTTRSGWHTVPTAPCTRLRSPCTRYVGSTPACTPRFSSALVLIVVASCERVSTSGPVKVSWNINWSCCDATLLYWLTEDSNCASAEVSWSSVPGRNTQPLLPGWPLAPRTGVTVIARIALVRL